MNLELGLLKTSVQYWVMFGASTGAFFSAADKCIQISNEKPLKYEHPIFEKPITGVYHTSRIAFSAGLGAFIGGTTALFAPVSIPSYIYWKSINKPVEKEN